MPLPTIQFDKFELEVQKQNTPLQEKAIAILTQAKSVTVVDNTSLKTANDIKKEINAQASTVKELRLEFTRPLDEFKKTILDAEKSILVNLDEAKAVVSGQILDYEEKLEADRRAEENRVQGLCEDFNFDMSDFRTVVGVEGAIDSTQMIYADCSEADQQNPAIKLAYTRCLNDLQARGEAIASQEKAEAERQRLAEQAKTQTAERAALEAEKARIELERQKLDDERRQLAREQEAQVLAASQAEAEKTAAKEAASKPKSNIVTNYDIEVVDPSQVPAKSLSPDEQKIRVAVKTGVREIAGVTITERKVVR